MPEVKYQILRADKPGTPPLDGYVFTDPAEAAKLSKHLSREMGEKLMVKPITDPKWREREANRFHNGEYRNLPWVLERWWNSDTARAISKDHFAHPSLERPGYIAYTKSPEDGTIDKQTIVRPGAYLKKYFDRVLYVYGVSERRTVEQFMIAYGPLDVKFAKTEEEIIAVYENGPPTCMMDKDWPGDGRNPAYLYAAGDLEVAYLGDLKKASARTLVWPEKKIHSRVYGDIARLTQGLHRLGYQWGAPIGARIQRVAIRAVKFHPDMGPPSHCFVAPYIDKRNQAGGGHLSIIEKDDHMVICEEGKPGSHHCGLADGHSGYYVPREDEYPTFTCDSCGKPGNRQLTSVFDDPENPDDNEHSWCATCVKRHAFKCRYSDTYFNIESVPNTVVDGLTWCQYYADMYAVRCEMNGYLYSQDNIMMIYIDGKPMNVSRTWLERNGGCFRSYFTTRYFLKRELVYVGSTEVGTQCAARSELKNHAFQCDGCQSYNRISDRYQTNGDDKLYCYYCDQHLRGLYSRTIKISSDSKSTYSLGEPAHTNF